MTDGIIDTHVSSQHNLWEVQPIDVNFNQIFNTDESGDDESGILDDSFPLTSLPSPLADDGSPYTPRIGMPLSLGDPLTSLSLPSLTYSTPQHEFSRQFSQLTQDSPSEFDKFTGVLDLGSADTNSSMFSPPRTDLDDIELRDLISTKPLPPASTAPRTPRNLENLLEVDPRSSQEQLQDIINTAVSINVSSPSPRASITEVPRSGSPLAPSSKQMSVSELTKSAASVPLTSENVSKIVNRLDDLISSNQSKVKLSAIPKNTANVPATTTKPIKPKPKRLKPNFVQPDLKRPIAKKVDPPKNRPNISRKSPTVSKSAPQGSTGSSPASKSYTNSSPSSTSSDNTSSTLETLASSLGIFRHAGTPQSSSQISKPSTPQPEVVKTVNSAPRPKKTSVKVNQSRPKQSSQPIVIGKSNTDTKAGFLKKPIVISQIPPQSTAVIRSKPALSQAKIVSATIKTAPTAAAGKQLIVPYKSPAAKPQTESKKYVLLPLEKLQNASPSVISQLGLDSSFVQNNKRSAPAIKPATTTDKRIKTETLQPSSSFTEKTEFPINITLPKSTKDKIKEFHGSIPEMMEKARAKRKSHLSNMSTFTQMETFINEFIQQNNDQVMEILFLKQNNKEINRKYNQLAKLFHVKNEEHKQLKREVEQLGIQNKKMEKELKTIKDLIKKYMS